MNVESKRWSAFPTRLSWGPAVLWIATVTLIYASAAWLSFSLIGQPEGITPVWPPNGIFLSAILLTRRGLRPFLVATLFTTDVAIQVLGGTPFFGSIVYALILAGDAVLSSWLLLRVVESPIDFTRVRDLFGFLVLAVIFSNAVSSFVAAAVSHWLEGAAFVHSWKWWVASDSVGDLLVTPFILSWASLARGGWAAWNPLRILEGATLLVSFAIANLFLFTYLPEQREFLLVLAYLAIPFLLWAALRFGVPGVSLALVLWAGIVIHFAIAGRVPTISRNYSQLDGEVVVQLYLAVLAVPSLLLAAAVATRKQTEEALRDSQQKLQALVEASPAPIITIDPEGLVRTWNPAAERMFGWTAQEAIGRFLPYMPPEAMAEHVAIRQRVLAGESVDCIEIRRRRKDSTPIDITLSTAPIYDAQGRVSGIMSVNLDVTRRKQAEQEALRQTRRLRILAHAAQRINSILVLPDIMRRLVATAMDLTGAAGGTAGLMADGRMVFTEYNRCGAWLPIDYRFDLDYGVPGWVMRTRTPYLTADAEHDPHVVPEIQKALGFHTLVDVPIVSGEGELLGCFELHDRSDNQPFDHDDTALLNGLAASAAVAMVNARLLAERQAAEVAAAQANQAKDEFLARLSHELRTPLTPTLLATTQWQTHAELPPALCDDLAMIGRNLKLEARLIDDLLDLTRIARGKVELDRRPVDLGEILRRAAEVCKPDIEARQLHFGMEASDEAYPVHADPARLQQVFWNLLKNAVKFTPHGGCVGIRCWREGSEETSLSVVVEVHDSGVGIEPEALSRIFNAFEQGSTTVTRQFGGLGLGLAISKALVEMHGGRIEASSPGAGRGATFRVTLPLCPSPSQAAGPRAPTDAAPPARTHVMRILLVEDHGDTARVLSRLIRNWGHEVCTAGDVATALETADQRCFDLLISDLGLPDRSGIDLIREIRARGQTLPAVALSGFGQEEDIARSKAAGFTEHLVKPVDFQALRQMLSRFAETTDPNCSAASRADYAEISSG